MDGSRARARPGRGLRLPSFPPHKVYPEAGSTQALSGKVHVPQALQGIAGPLARKTGKSDIGAQLGLETNRTQGNTWGQSMDETMKSRFEKPHLLFLMTMFILLVGGCGSAYILVDNKEFTSGGLFADKYAEREVIISGQFENLEVGVIGREEKFIVLMLAKGGLKPIPVFAERKFSKLLYSLKRGDPITVYGTARVTMTKSRIDKGLVQQYLGVNLKKIRRTSKK